MTQLTTLHVDREDFGDDESWALLAKLTSLQELRLVMSGSGDPSPLSALTGLTSLYIDSGRFEETDSREHFIFCSLQPLSTLQQLERLELISHACAATSLQGLGGLSNLKKLVLDFSDYGGPVSLAGISPGVVELSISHAHDLMSLAGIEGYTSMEKLSLFNCGVSSLQHLGGLSSLKDLEVYDCSLISLEGLDDNVSLQTMYFNQCSSLNQLSGIEHLSALKSLELLHCGVTSLQPLSQLGEGLQKLRVYHCEQVQEEVLELPHVQPSANVTATHSNVKEVVLAGGARRTV
jgi:Leucine-rich repeat (LRR) protein